MDVVFGFARTPVDVQEPRVRAELVEHRVVLNQAQLPAQQPVATSCVHYHRSRNGDRLTCDAYTHADGALVLVKEDLFDARALVDLGTELFGMFEEQEVHLRSVDVIAVVLINARLWELAKLDRDGAIPACHALANRPTLDQGPLDTPLAGV